MANSRPIALAVRRALGTTGVGAALLLGATSTFGHSLNLTDTLLFDANLHPVWAPKSGNCTVNGGTCFGGVTGLGELTGATGSTGATGATGASGATGSSGATGASGGTGGTGGTGTFAFVGAPVGIDKTFGAAGPADPNEPDANKIDMIFSLTDTGGHGTTGATGSTGTTGTTGSTGSTGATGATGATGGVPTAWSFAFTETIHNETDLAFSDYHLALGSGSGAGFAAPDASLDGLHFESISVGGANPFGTTSDCHAGCTDIWFDNGTVTEGGSFTVSFNLVVPEALTGTMFTLRQMPSTDSPTGTIPEPGTTGLLGSGLLGLWLARRRRRRPRLNYC